VRVLLATGNRKKAAEMAAILAAPGLEYATLADFPALASPVEDGATFLENARIKARAGAVGTGRATIGEDSGLAVDALDGAPGVFSARYAEGDDRARWERLLRELREVPAGRRAARYVCVAVLALPGGGEEVAEGACEGEIAFQPRGAGGFGYDPVFLLPDGRTMAELSPAEKDAISHRGKALRALAPRLLALVTSTR
jgi:XTP/dITP diphosphohydrolase